MQVKSAVEDVHISIVMIDDGMCTFVSPDIRFVGSTVADIDLKSLYFSFFKTINLGRLPRVSMFSPKAS